MDDGTFFNENETIFECYVLSNFKLHGDSDYVGVVKIPSKNINFKSCVKNGVLRTNMIKLCERIDIEIL